MAKTRVFEFLVGYIDENGVQHTECEIARLDGVSEEIISDKKLSQNPAKLITALLTNQIKRIGTIVNPPEHVIRGLFTGDRDLALMELRKVSFGEEMVLESTCRDRNCKETHDIIIDLDEDVTIIKWNPDENSNHLRENIGHIPFQLIDGYEDKEGNVHKNGILKFATGQVEENIAPILRRNPGEANTSLLTSCIKELGSLRMVDTKVVRSLTRRDREYLAKLIKENQPGPRFILEDECPVCLLKYDFIIELPYFFTGGK